MKFILPLSALAFALTACSNNNNIPSKPSHKASFSVDREHLAYDDRDTIFFGGYGSAMAYNQCDSTFYLLTDRGPNTDGPSGESKYFPVVDFSPTIGKFKLVDGHLTLIEKILLHDLNGKPFRGTPNREGDGVTGEIAYDFDGNILNSSLRGIDSEGLALCNDGSFWVSDEYAPFIIHFNAQGQALKVLSPSNGLPAHYYHRRANRGMEGLTINKNNTKLYGIMQSPLLYPDKSTKNTSRVVRILELDINTLATREFVYMLDDPSLVCSEILFVDDNTFYVIERDGAFNTPERKAVKLIYSINLAGATNIGNTPVEKLSAESMASKGIIPVEKTLLIDVITAFPDYSHDKLEGIALYSERTLAIVNDDDFGIEQGQGTSYRAKRNSKGEVDKVMVHLIDF